MLLVWIIIRVMYIEYYTLYANSVTVYIIQLKTNFLVLFITNVCLTKKSSDYVEWQMQKLLLRVLNFLHNCFMSKHSFNLYYWEPRYAI